MANIKISVLMPAYNAEKYIREAIESILNQTYHDWELLICDDKSSDKTLKVIESYKDRRILIYENNKNLKKPETVNFLFSKSMGELITIHDADDISLSTRFEEIVKYFESHPDIYMCGHIIQRITRKGKLLPLLREKNEKFEDIVKSLEKDNTDGDSSIFIKREIVDDIGGLLRPYFQNNMDYDLALRITERFKSTNLLKTLSLYRNVPTSISKNITSYQKLTTQKMTQFFAKERKERGSDSLMEKKWDLIKIKEQEFAEPYLNDKSLYLRETAARFMYLKMFSEAIKLSFKAVLSSPFKIVNLRTFQYCLRKSIFKI